MRARLIEIARSASGAVAQKTREVESEVLLAGRGTDNEIQLNDLGVALRHLEIRRLASGRLQLSCARQGSVILNGKPVQRAELRAGDALRLGRYALRIQEISEAGDPTIEIEEVERAIEPSERQKATSVAGIDQVLSRRRIAWLVLLTLAFVFLALPLVLGVFRGSWSSGGVAGAHAAIAADCEACHAAAFTSVRDQECLVCHASVGAHAAPGVQVEALDSLRCASCHVEHEGREGLAAIEAGFCAGCHAVLSQIHPETELPGASDFATHHPEFRPAVATGSEPDGRERLEWRPDLRERSGLHFDHLRHVGRVVGPPDSRKKKNLDCGECHDLEAGGRHMVPVLFETTCERCHPIAFDEDHPRRPALHGDPVAMRTDLREFYSQLALRGQPAGLPEALLRRIPGRPLTEEERKAVLAWVEQEVARADDFLFGEKGACTQCHDLRLGRAEDGGHDVEPVVTTASWLRKARFSHAAHEYVACRTCHSAAAVYDPEFDPELVRPSWSARDAVPYGLLEPGELAAETGLAPSTDGDDVLLPGLETCRECHGGADAQDPKVVSPCFSCHSFHHREHGPLRPTASPRVASSDGAS